MTIRHWAADNLDKIPNDVLLKILCFYVDEDEDFEPFKIRRIEERITLAHVCRRWRSIVFQSPRRLNLRLLCTSKTPVRDTLDIWPPLPLIISDLYGILDDEPSSVDNINHHRCTRLVTQAQRSPVSNQTIFLYRFTNEICHEFGSNA